MGLDSATIEFYPSDEVSWQPVWIGDISSNIALPQIGYLRSVLHLTVKDGKIVSRLEEIEPTLLQTAYTEFRINVEPGQVWIQISPVMKRKRAVSGTS
jgi:hypothetical protein